MPIAHKHKLGVYDLLITEQQNVVILMQLAKSVTKSICEIPNEAEALDYVLKYVDDIHVLLNKRHLTKEVLFKYLHKRTPNASINFTKSDLIKHIIEYWDSCSATDTDETNNRNGAEHKWHGSTTVAVPEESFPINLMARKFTEWFFDNYNGGNLKLADFWTDAQLKLCIIANDGDDEQCCVGAEQTLQMLMDSKGQFNFYFNPNLTHAGVQGRMDAHGLVLVLSCGTLHTQQQCVGVFECIFGLLRDPYAENNWKPKRIQCVLRSQATLQAEPSLINSHSLSKALTLPTTGQELS